MPRYNGERARARKHDQLRRELEARKAQAVRVVPEVKPAEIINGKDRLGRCFH